jgi:hypothetical protein
LLEDGRIHELIEKEYIVFDHETKQYYGQLTEKEREMRNKIIDTWNQKKPRGVVLGGIN